MTNTQSRIVQWDGSNLLQKLLAVINRNVRQLGRHFCGSSFHFPASIYLLKANNRNTRTRCEICSKLTIKTLGRHQWHRSEVFIANFEHILHLVLAFLLLTLNMKLPAGLSLIFPYTIATLYHSDLRLFSVVNKIKCKYVNNSRLKSS